MLLLDESNASNMQYELPRYDNIARIQFSSKEFKNIMREIVRNADKFEDTMKIQTQKGKIAFSMASDELKANFQIHHQDEGNKVDQLILLDHLRAEDAATVTCGSKTLAQFSKAGIYY